MEIKKTKKANSIIATFSEREKQLYEYLFELYKNTVEKIENCTREIEIYENDKPIYRQTIKAEMDAEFRLKYIFQCFGIYANYNHETKTFEAKTMDDK